MEWYDIFYHIAVTEQLHWSSWELRALLRGTSMVLMKEGQVLLFPFPTQTNKKGQSETIKRYIKTNASRYKTQNHPQPEEIVPAEII